MKTIHKKLLKKLTVEDIEEMRAMMRSGFDIYELAKAFNVNITTILWHCADIYEDKIKIL